MNRENSIYLSFRAFGCLHKGGQIFAGKSKAASGAKGVPPLLDVDAVLFPRLGSVMSVLHDTVPDYGVTDKLKVKLTTARKPRRHCLLSVKKRCPNLRRMQSRSSMKSLASGQTSCFSPSMPNAGWTKTASANLCHALLENFWLRSFHMVEKLMTPFHGCLPSTTVLVKQDSTSTGCGSSHLHAGRPRSPLNVKTASMNRLGITRRRPRPPDSDDGCHRDMLGVPHRLRLAAPSDCSFHPEGSGVDRRPQQQQQPYCSSCPASRRAL